MQRIQKKWYTAVMNEGIRLWLRPQPFEFGVLKIQPNSRLSKNNIFKIVGYLREKSEIYPLMSYSTWSYIACKKLLLSEEYAWMFFRLYQLFGAKNLKRIKREDKLFQNRMENAHLITINAIKFALFLFIQNIMCFRAKRGSTEQDALNEETRSNSKRNLTEGLVMRFFLSELDNILNILSAENLDRTAIESFSFLVEGSNEGSNETIPLIRILEENEHLAQEAGKNNLNLYDKKLFFNFIKKYLIKCPFGSNICFSNGQNSYFSKFYLEQKICSSNKFPRILDNFNMIPNDDSNSYKLILFAYLNDITFSEDSMNHLNVKIMKCQNCFFYLLCPLKSLLIESCLNCTFIVGPVELITSLSKCINTSLSCLSRQFILTTCQRTLMHVGTPQRPLLSQNTSTTIAPLNIYYETLPQQMKHVNFLLDINMWNNPLLYTPTNGDDPQTFSALPPEKFYQHKIPFENYNVVNLPKELISEEYYEALGERKIRNEKFRETIKGTELSESQSEKFNELMSSEFDEWLVFSCNKKQLLQLDKISDSY